MANGGYLEKDRLAHVIAAIQIMAVADAPSGSLTRWIGELDAGEADGERGRTAIHYADRKKWSSVFEEHPEFFKVFTMKGEPQVALRMRLALSAHAQPADGEASDAPSLAPEPASPDEDAPAAARAGETHKRTKSTDRPLSNDQIEVLINTAIKLHGMTEGDARPPERGASRWLFSAAGAVGGAIVGGAAVAVFVAFMVWSPVAIQIFD
ncbi:MAG: hypothetical protein FJX62_03720 [Alphaproteobacteria bacterium]|nr:hypothetical protein [Alphaproteobacteria bacterium]